MAKSPGKPSAQVDLAAPSRETILKAKVRRWVLQYLRDELPYHSITVDTLLSLFKDNNVSLSVLAGAFADEVQRGSTFTGLVDPATLSIPADDYSAAISAPKATVAQIISFLYGRAKAAAPPKKLAANK